MRFKILASFISLSSLSSESYLSISDLIFFKCESISYSETSRICFSLLNSEFKSLTWRSN